jgi:hypothetical protein
VKPRGPAPKKCSRRCPAGTLCGRFPTLPTKKPACAGFVFLAERVGSPGPRLTPRTFESQCEPHRGSLPSPPTKKPACAGFVFLAERVGSPGPRLTPRTFESQREPHRGSLPSPPTKKPACAGFVFLAERVGFEPTVRLPVRLISSQVHSTTLPPLRNSASGRSGSLSNQTCDSSTV